MFLAGCTDKTKDNPTRSLIEEHGMVASNPFHHFAIAFSTSMDPGYLHSRAYVPPGYDIQPGEGRPYPILYLLSPFRGDELYYFEHGLAEVADRLLDQGKIQPMIIVCIDGRSQLGGSFYTDSPQQGDYYSAFFEDDIFYVDLLIDPSGEFVGTFESYRGPYTLESVAKLNRIIEWYNTVDDPKARAISGVGMGGYGAFALALKTDLFGSVSAVNAPLDFDGSGGGGFLTLLNEVIPAEWTSIETSPTGRVDTVYNVDTSLADPAMSLVVSASAAFSEHYTNVQMDSVYVTERDSLLIWGYTPIDSLTDNLISYLPTHGVHTPFDSLGGLNTFIWDLWMDHNIQNIYEADTSGYATAFSQMPKFLVKSEGAKFYYGEQMESFISFLNNNTDPSKLDVMEFRGNQILTGTADHFLYDILEDILIFHSDNFEIPGDIQ
jgi:hypothetical protein